MTEPSLPDSASARQPRNHAVWLGFLVVFAGFLSYFLYFFRFANLRDFPWINLPVIAIGLIMSAVGLRRAFAASRGLVSKILGSIGFLASAGLATLFVSYVFFLSYQLPADDGTAQVGSIAPDFTLLDPEGEELQLSSLRGKKVVVSFYRGFW